MIVVNFFKNHWLVLMLAIGVSVIYGSHHFFISRVLERQGLEYYPVTLAGNRDEGAFYGQRASAVFQGQWLAGDISVAGNQNSPAILPKIKATAGIIASSMSLISDLTTIMFSNLNIANWESANLGQFSDILG